MPNYFWFPYILIDWYLVKVGYNDAMTLLYLLEQIIFVTENSVLTDFLKPTQTELKDIEMCNLASIAFIYVSSLLCFYILFISNSCYYTV